ASCRSQRGSEVVAVVAPRRGRRAGDELTTARLGGELEYPGSVLGDAGLGQRRDRQWLVECGRYGDRRRGKPARRDEGPGHDGHHTADHRTRCSSLHRGAPLRLWTAYAIRPATAPKTVDCTSSNPLAITEMRPFT